MDRFNTAAAPRSPSLRAVYLLTAFLLTLSGFAQMPIFKRYYIADVPGLGWLAEYYVTHRMHYIAAAAFLALAAYVVVRHAVAYRLTRQVTASGYVRAIFILAIVATGVPRVIKNFEGVNFSSGLIIYLDLLHLAAVTGFLLASLYAALRRRPWARAVSR